MHFRIRNHRFREPWRTSPPDRRSSAHRRAGCRRCWEWRRKASPAVARQRSEFRRRVDQVARCAHDAVLPKRTFGRVKAPRLDGVLANVLGADMAPPGRCKELGTTFLEPEYRYDPFFVEVHLAGPNDKQARQFDTSRGGLWLITQGIEAVGLALKTVKLPPEVSVDPVASLNHVHKIVGSVRNLAHIPYRKHLQTCPPSRAKRETVSAGCASKRSASISGT